MFVVTAMEDGYAVGMTRIVSDGGYFALVVDAIVLKASAAP